MVGDIAAEEIEAVARGGRRNRAVGQKAAGIDGMRVALKPSMPLVGALVPACATAPPGVAGFTNAVAARQ